MRLLPGFLQVEGYKIYLLPGFSLAEGSKLHLLPGFFRVEGCNKVLLPGFNRQLPGFLPAEGSKTVLPPSAGSPEGGSQHGTGPREAEAVGRRQLLPSAGRPARDTPWFRGATSWRSLSLLLPRCGFSA